MIKNSSEYLQEEKRLEEIYSYEILDSDSEKEFDDISFLAKEIFHSSMIMIGFFDKKRFWIKSKIGIPIKEIPKDIIFFSDLHSQERMIFVSDTWEDEKLKSHPMMTSGPKIRSFAIYHLFSKNGFFLGSFCIMDHSPRVFGETEKKALIALGGQIESRLEIRKLLLIEEQRRLYLERVSSCLENIHVGVWEWDLDSNKIYFDKTMFQIYGFHDENFSGNYIDWENFIYERDKREVIKKLKESLTSGKSLHIFFRVYSPRFGLRHISRKAECLFKNGKPLKMIGIDWDITEDMEKNIFSKKIYEESFQPIITLNFQGEFQSVNLAFSRLLGFHVNSFKGKKINDFFDKDDDSFLFSKNLSREETFFLEKRLLNSDGNQIHVSIRSQIVFDINDHPSYFLSFITDLTEQKKQEEILKEKNSQIELEKQKFENFVYALNASAIVSITDLNGVTTFVNEKFCHIFDCDRDELIGNDHYLKKSELTKNQNFSEILEKLKFGSIWHGEAKHKKKDSSICWIDTTIVPFLDIHGHPNQYIIIQFDTTDRKNLEDHLIESREMERKANNAKSDFLSSMSHEIRTPLNGIIGMTDILVGLPMEDEQKKYVETIYSSGKILLDLINDILDYSKIESGNMEVEIIEFDLNHLVKDLTVSHMFKAKSKGVDFEINLPDISFKVFGDSKKITQVFNNLISNAIKFTEKGFVRISITIIQETQYYLELNISVKDSGIGIPKGKQGNLFQVFTQMDKSISRKYGGTGLGLSIVKKLVELMGGYISVESEEGKGTNFILKQSFKKGSLISKENEQTVTSYVQKYDNILSGHILVVEDNKVNQKIISHMLKDLGCKMVLANHGQEALDLIKKETFDIVLMDCHMPIMDGYEATRAIRLLDLPNAKDILIIALTANAFESDRKACLDAGMNDFMTKPVTKEKLFQYLSRYLKQK